VSLEVKSGASVRLRERELDWKNLAPYMRLRYNEENNNIMKDVGRTRENRGCSSSSVWHCSFLSTSGYPQASPIQGGLCVIPVGKKSHSSQWQFLGWKYCI